MLNNTKICKICGKELLLSEFRKRPNMQERFDVCKTCYIELKDKGYKVCPVCGNAYLFTKEYFNINNKKRNGLDTTCRACARKKVNLWEKRNKEKVNIRVRRYLKTDKGKKANYRRVRSYESRKLKLVYTLTDEQWLLIRECFGNRCAYCGRKLPLEQEHFIALTKGGEYTINNIIPACKSCNSSKGNKDFFVWYPSQSFYSKNRQQKILKYLNYKGKVQQTKLI